MFIEQTQKRVSGTVKLKLFKGSLRVVGRESRYSLYNHKIATYGKGSKFNQKLAKGFVELWGMQSTEANKLPKAIVIKKKLKKDVEILYASFKEFEKTHSSPEEVNEFKQACNNVIRSAQKSHAEIKDKVYTIYDKKK